MGVLRHARPLRSRAARRRCSRLSRLTRRRCKLAPVTAFSISMKRAAPIFVGCAIAIACGGATPNSETPNGGSEWKQLRISWDFGPCPNDGRACHQVLTVDHDGGLIASDERGTKRYAALEPQE